MKQKLLIMLDMQDQMNQKVHPEWETQGYEWYRAIWVECAELMDHFGWKWWKKHHPDRDQVVLELIDIWHFGLSSLLQTGKSHEIIAEDLRSNLDLLAEGGDFLCDVEAFAQNCLQHRTFDMAGFARLMIDMELSFTELFRSYVGKNVLNFFRQDHGYKEGGYHKLWHGKEDNEHLIEAVQALDADSESFKQDLYAALLAKYPKEAPEEVGQAG